MRRRNRVSAVKALAQGVKRRRAEIAENDAERRQRKNKKVIAARNFAGDVRVRVCRMNISQDRISHNYFFKKIRSMRVFLKLTPARSPKCRPQFFKFAK